MAEPPIRPLCLAAGGLVSLAASMGLGRFIYTPILPFMVEELGLSQSAAGLIASANFAGYLLGAVLVARPVLPGSRRSWLLAALAASALTTGLTGLGTSLLFFLAVRFMGGVASAFALVFSSALVLERLAATGRTDLFALYFAGVGVGIAVSAALVSVLAGFASPWPWFWVWGAIASTLGLALAAVLIPERGEIKPATGPAGARGRDDLGRLVTAYGLFGFGYIITATFIVALVRATPDIRPLEPAVWLIVGLVGAPSIAVWTSIGKTIGIFRAFALACLLEAVGVAASVLWTSMAGAIVAAALLGGTFMAISALGLVGARDLSPVNPRRTLALMTASFGLGQIIGPTFAGLVHDLTGGFMLPSLAAAAALIVAAALAAFVEARPPARPRG